MIEKLRVMYAAEIERIYRRSEKGSLSNADTKRLIDLTGGVRVLESIPRAEKTNPEAENKSIEELLEVLRGAD